MTDLKPCPFCGGEKLNVHAIRDGKAIGCRCGASLSLYHGRDPDTEARVFAAWNRRPHPTAPDDTGEGRERPCFECGSTERYGSACAPCNPELAPKGEQGEAVAWRYREKGAPEWCYRVSEPHPNRYDEIQPLFAAPPSLPGREISDDDLEEVCRAFVSEADSVWSHEVWPDHEGDTGHRGDGAYVKHLSEAAQDEVRRAMRFALARLGQPGGEG